MARNPTGPLPMQLVVVMAVSAAVSAATIIFTTSSKTFFLSICIYFFIELRIFFFSTTDLTDYFDHELHVPRLQSRLGAKASKNCTNYFFFQPRISRIKRISISRRDFIRISRIAAACSGGFGLLFGRICNPAVSGIGICNPAITVVSHFKCLYSALADCKSARTRIRLIRVIRGFL